MPLLRLLPAALILATLPLVAPVLRAQPAAGWTYLPYDTGLEPYAAPVPGPDGALYGTTRSGGNVGLGTLYRLDPAGALSTRLSFYGFNGVKPEGPLVRGGDGALYGSTRESINFGTLFRLGADGVLSTLHRFAYQSGGDPSALSAGADGNLYGTTRADGLGGKGTVFRLTPAGQFTVLAHFGPNGPAGANPVAPPILARDGALYGTTPGAGGTPRTLYRLVPGEAVISVVHPFTAEEGYPGPDPLVEDAAGNLLGNLRTAAGGQAAVFRRTPAGAVGILARFAARSPDAYNASLPLVPGGDGNFYGTAAREAEVPGTLPGGIVFRLTPGGEFSVVAQLDGIAPGATPRGVHPGPDGALYGVCAGSFFAPQVLFRCVPTTGEVTPLHTFARPPTANGNLCHAPDGNLYGADTGSLSVPPGIFRLTPAGVRTRVTALDSLLHGSPSVGPLCPDADGHLLGVASSGGPNQRGTVFRVTLPAGEVSTVFSFNGINGTGPAAGLLPGPGGVFYGTTVFGGTNDQGTVFRLAADGTLTTLFSFHGTNGAEPRAPLVFGPDGTLYGTTELGGANNGGTAFRLRPDTGEFTRLVSFPSSVGGTLGTNPVGPLVLAEDGNFYGATRNGGSFGYGSIFRLTPAGAATLRSAFRGNKPENGNPTGGLVRGADGALYGTTSLGGFNDVGTLYRFSPASGERLTVRGFEAATDGVGPLGTPALGPDGHLYGAARHTLWRFPLPTAAEVWRVRFFNTTANVGPAADEADPDGDDLENVLERALGLNPTAANTTAGRLAIIREGGTGLLLHAQKGPDAADLLFSAETSTDLQTWTTTGVTVLQDNPTDFKARTDAPAGPRRFLRLRVMRP